MTNPQNSKAVIPSASRGIFSIVELRSSVACSFECSRVYYGDFIEPSSNGLQ